MIDEPIVGHASVAAQNYFSKLLRRVGSMTRPICVLSTGETTVEVKGNGLGGRNQEFGLSLVESIASAPCKIVMASVGSDGIDGPTDAAGAVVDSTSLARAKQLGLGAPAKYLKNNDSYAYFSSLEDLIKMGPTDTNIGDIQVALLTDADS